MGVLVVPGKEKREGERPRRQMRRAAQSGKIKNVSAAGLLCAYMVPPALCEVWQHVLEGELDDLKEDAHEPTQIHVAEEEGLAEPPEEVCEDELVKHGILCVCAHGESSRANENESV